MILSKFKKKKKKKGNRREISKKIIFPHQNSLPPYCRTSNIARLSNVTFFPRIILPSCIFMKIHHFFQKCLHSYKLVFAKKRRMISLLGLYIRELHFKFRWIFFFLFLFHSNSCRNFDSWIYISTLESDKIS